MKVKKGDRVKILSGKDRGKTGQVLRVFPAVGRLVVEGANVVKKHQKASGQKQKSERISFEAPIDVSNVQLVCPKCSKPTRLGAKLLGDRKVRVCKKCQAEI